MQQRGSLPHARGAPMQGNNQFSGWREHRDPNGFVYLSNPMTGERRWLWSRHHDPTTKRDYMYNVATGKRDWVTSTNEHLCPRPTTAPQSTRSQTRSPAGSAPRGSPRGGPRAAPRGSSRGGPRAAAPDGNPVLIELAEARKQCGPDEFVVRNPTSGKLELRNRVTGVMRPFIMETKGGPPAAALLIQRAYRALAVRRVLLPAKLRALKDAVADINALVAPGTKYDLAELRRVASNSVAPLAKKTEAADRLLHLGEILTQAMLKLDGFESHGFDIIRNHRKRSVKRIISLTEAVEDARAKLKSKP